MQRKWERRTRFSAPVKSSRGAIGLMVRRMSLVLSCHQVRITAVHLYLQAPNSTGSSSTTPAYRLCRREQEIQELLSTLRIASEYLERQRTDEVTVVKNYDTDEGAHARWTLHTEAWTSCGVLRLGRWCSLTRRARRSNVEAEETGMGALSGGLITRVERLRCAMVVTRTAPQVTIRASP